MKDDADLIDKIAIDRLRGLAEKRYALGREKFGVTDLDKDSRDFIEETIEELIDTAWYLAAKLVQVRRQDEAWKQKIMQGLDVSEEDLKKIKGISIAEQLDKVEKEEKSNVAKRLEQLQLFTLERKDEKEEGSGD